LIAGAMDKTRPRGPRVLLVLVLAVVCILYFALFERLAVDIHDNFASSRLVVTLVRADYLRFWYVGQRFLEAWPALAESPALLAKQFPLDILGPAPASLKAWLYPPTMNLLAMLFALLPMTVSFWAWTVLTMLAAMALLRRAGLGWGAIILGLLSPADMYNFVGGQTGLLMGALLVACLLTVDTRPRFAGLLAGCLSLKPQVGLAFIAVLPGRLRRLLPWAVLSFLIWLALSLSLEGPAAWVRFFAVAGPVGTRILDGPLKDASPAWSLSVFMMLRSFGAPGSLAGAGQVISSVVGLALVGYAWRGAARAPVRRMAFTVTVSLLVTPYGFVYDLVGFGIAMAAMGLSATDRRKPVFACLWVIPGYLEALFHASGFVVFPIVAVIAAALCHPFVQPDG